MDPDPNDPDKKEISWHAVYYHYRKWSRDGSLERVWKGSILTISPDLHLSELNLDGSHVIVKKGGCLSRPQEIKNNQYLTDLRPEWFHNCFY